MVNPVTTHEKCVNQTVRNGNVLTCDKNTGKLTIVTINRHRLKNNRILK